MRTGPNIHLRKDGRWEARYQKGRDANGRIMYGFVYGATQDEAERKRADLLSKTESGIHYEKSVLASLNPNISVPEIAKYRNKTVKSKLPRYVEPFSDDEALALEYYFVSEITPVNLCYYFCLHLGLSTNEICAVKYSDIDLEKRQLTVKRRTDQIKGKRYPIESSRQERIIPLPDFVKDYIIRIYTGEEMLDEFIYTGDKYFADSHIVSLTFRRIAKRCLNITVVSPDSLRSTFIRRLLESCINIETASELTGLDKNVLYKRYPLSIKSHPEALLKMCNPDVDKKDGTVKPSEMNLLIFGAGSHGHAVMEVAEKLGVFQEIKFLDDSVTGENILGKCSDCGLYTGRFPCCFVAIGDNEIRKKYTELARSYGFILVRLLSNDTSTISKNAVIGAGTIVMPQATVNAATIGEGCIIASNALVGYGSNIGDFCHIDIGGLVNKEVSVPELTQINSGEIYKG